MRLLRSMLLGALALVTVGAAPAAERDELVLDLVSPYVVATIDGKPIRLRVDFDTPANVVFLNPDIVARARLRPSTSQTVTEPVTIAVSSTTSLISFGTRKLNLTVRWSAENAIDGADGVIGPQSLPENRITLRLHRPLAGERTIELPMAQGDLLSYRMTVGKQVLLVLAAPQSGYSVATAAAGAHLATVQDGHWAGAPTSIDFYWAGKRPARSIALRQPLSLNGLPLRNFMVRTADFRGGYRLPPDEPELSGKADSDEIVVTARPSKGTPRLELKLGLDVLGACSSISHDRRRRMLILQCIDRAGEAPGGQVAQTEAAVPPGLKAPVPGAPFPAWITARDFPAEVLKSETVTGPLNFALTVSTEGSVIRCAIEGGSGATALDDKACRLLEERGRFSPATDSAGKPTLGVYRGVLTWAGPNMAPAIPLIEIAVALQKMPEPLPNAAYFEIAVSVDATGRVDGCATENGSGQTIAARIEAGKILGPTACGEAVKALKLEAAKTAEGVAVRSVQMARVLFSAQPAANRNSAPSSKDAADPDAAILVESRNIKGKIIRPEAVIAPPKGFARIVDYQAIGNEVVLVLSDDQQWYRMEFEPRCIGNSRLTKTSRIGFQEDDGAEVLVDRDMIERLPRKERDALFNQIVDGIPTGPNGGIILPKGIGIEEGLGFTTLADGSFDRRSEVVAKTIDPQDVVHIDSCRIRSLVESEPPKGWKQSSKPARIPVPEPPAVRPTAAPDGGPVYPVEWVEKPTPDLLAKMAGGRPGSGWIICQTAADNKVSNCRTASESPRMSGVANRMKQASDAFRVRPPTVDGRPAIGAWVAIGFDFTPPARRQTALQCNRTDPQDPC